MEVFSSALRAGYFFEKLCWKDTNPTKKLLKKVVGNLAPSPALLLWPPLSGFLAPLLLFGGCPSCSLFLLAGVHYRGRLCAPHARLRSLTGRACAEHAQPRRHLLGTSVLDGDFSPRHTCSAWWTTASRSQQRFATSWAPIATTPTLSLPSTVPRTQPPRPKRRARRAPGPAAPVSGRAFPRPTHLVSRSVVAAPFHAGITQIQNWIASLVKN